MRIGACGRVPEADEAVVLIVNVIETVNVIDNIYTHTHIINFINICMCTYTHIYIYIYTNVNVPGGREGADVRHLGGTR